MHKLNKFSQDGQRLDPPKPWPEAPPRLNHPHLATSYEFQAIAERRLKAIALPLTGAWAMCSDRPRPTKGLECGFKEGDRLYFQEEWRLIQGRTMDGFLLKSLATDPGGVWEPASTMPPEIAQYWFAIAGVRVRLLGGMTFQEFSDCGLGVDQQELSNFFPALERRWNAAYPEQLMESDHYAIVLAIVPLAI